MCAENAQVILCYLEESHRPSRNNQTQQTPNTQKQPNNTGPGLGKGRLFVSCKCETNLRRGETGAIELSKTDSHYSMRMSHCSKFGLQAFEMLRNITKHRVAFAVPFCAFFCTSGDDMCAWRRGHLGLSNESPKSHRRAKQKQPNQHPHKTKHQPTRTAPREEEIQVCTDRVKHQ